MTDPSESLLEPGTMLAHYEVRLPLGAGAMGTVYEAYDTSLDRKVAVKVLRPEISGNQETVARFVREARAAARVNHVNLVHIYFVGQEDERRYFAMEYVPGRTFAEEIEAEGPMDLERAIDALVQAARGLAAAHEAGVIHRDVKPSNLKILPDGSVKVMDFGLAKSLEAEVDVTGTGSILGTPRYMSPEQCRGEKVDWRTDLYSLGLLGWFLLAGKSPYSDRHIGKILDDQMNRPLPTLAEARPELSPAVQKALDRICAKKPDDRPASMEEAIGMLEALRPRFLDLAPLAARGSALLIDVLLAGILAAAVSFLAEVGTDGWVQEWGRLIGTILACFGYMVGMEAWHGASLGKAALGLRVVGRDGNAPSLLTLALRFFCRFPVALLLPLDAVLLHASAIAWGVQLIAILVGVSLFLALRRRTFSDLVTNTRVVYRQSPGRRERAKAS